jgi:hypothetical protein
MVEMMVAGWVVYWADKSDAVTAEKLADSSVAPTAAQMEEALVDYSVDCLVDLLAVVLSVRSISCRKGK